MREALLLFAAGVVALLLVHVVRAIRHALLFAEGDVPERFDLLLGLALSYVVNTVVPLRVGELVRVLFVANRLRLRASYVAATVLAERLSDLVVVATGIAVTASLAARPMRETVVVAATFFAAAVLVVALLGAIRRSERTRRVAWRLASVFNDRIRTQILEFLWNAGQLVREGQLFRPAYVGATVAMWLLYLTGYALFAQAAGLPVGEVSFSLLGAPLQPLVEEILRRGGISRVALAYLAFTSLPVLAVLGYGLLRRHTEIRRMLQAVRRAGLGADVAGAMPPSRRFRDLADYGAFLQAHFGTANRAVARFGVGGTEDAIIHRLLPGGSDAVTAVVEVDAVLRIRKFAVGGAGEKLRVQADWMRRHRDELPLTDVVTDRLGGGGYRYDMPYLIEARDYYDVVHTAPLRTSMQLLSEVLAAVDTFHKRHAGGEAPPAIVDQYLVDKAQANARTILARIRDVVGDEYTINGEPHALADWEHVLDLEWLREQVRTRGTSVVHGDLTVENIIVCTDCPRGWYLIDPNPENVFDSPLIDWGKLMQSLHLGYEGLNRGTYASVDGGVLHVPFARSNAYVQLHTFLTHTLRRRLGPAGLREVAFHELVNYLRLTPYKFRQDSRKGLTFFACTSILLRRYLDAVDAPITVAVEPELDGRAPERPADARRRDERHADAASAAASP